MADMPVLLPQGYGDTEFVEANAELLEGDVLSLFVPPVRSQSGGHARARDDRVDRTPAATR